MSSTSRSEAEASQVRRKAAKRSHHEMAPAATADHPQFPGGTLETGQPGGLHPADVLKMQTTFGNRAVGRMLGRDRQLPRLATPKLQRQEVGNQFYAHGGFMGAARQLLNDAKWRRILQVLMPDVYADVEHETDEGELIPMLENNPVASAYGMFRTQSLDESREGGRDNRVANMQAFEWDVWLDRDIVRAYSVAFTDQVMDALDRELVDRMVIAHGNTKQTIIENKVGYPQYDAVRETRKSGMGGATPGAWMDLFGRALRLAKAENLEEQLADMAREPRHTDEDDQALYQTFEQQMPFSEVIDLYKETFGKRHFSVLLDVKSRNAEPWVLAKLIRELNRRGVHVYGVGTFTFSELNDLDKVEQDVAGEEMGAPRGIKFFHGIGNLQSACTDGEVFEGDTVMFNAGSILDSVDWDADEPDADDPAIEAIIRDLGTFKNTYGFHLGLYVQEGSTDRRAARKITDFSNAHADIFDLGFGWGGVGNDMGPVRDGGTGMGSQSWIPWNEWDEDETPGAPPVASFQSSFSIKRFLESRHFEVKRGRVEVRSQAEWDSERAPTGTYTITLRQSDWFRDTTYTRFRFPVGTAGNARWSGLEDGTYYLEIDVADQEDATLNGDIKVNL